MSQEKRNAIENAEKALNFAIECLAWAKMNGTQLEIIEAEYDANAARREYFRTTGDYTNEYGYICANFVIG